MAKTELEYIVWIDPHSVDEWSEIEEIKLDTCKIITFGQVIKEDPQTIAIALNVDHAENKASCVMIIPKICILDRRSLDHVTIQAKS